MHRKGPEPEGPAPTRPPPRSRSATADPMFRIPCGLRLDEGNTMLLVWRSGECRRDGRVDFRALAAQGGPEPKQTPPKTLPSLAPRSFVGDCTKV